MKQTLSQSQAPAAAAARAGTRLDVARALLQEGRPVEALQLVQPLSGRAGADLETCILQGACHAALSHFEAALAAYGQALALAPQDGRLRFMCGEMAYHLGRHAEVVEFLGELDAGDDTPLAVEHAITLGRSQLYLGMTVQAELNLLRAYVLDPGSQNAAIELALFYEHDGQWQRALYFLQAAARVHKDSRRIHYNLGSVLSQCGRTEESIEALQHVIALAPDDARAHLNLALTCLRTSRLPQGWRHYAWRYNPHFADVPQARWRPQVPSLPADMRGRVVQVVGEQGIGDELFFMRFLPLLQARGAVVHYRLCNPKLLPLMERMDASCLPAEWRLFDPQERSTDSLRLLVGDLPLALGAPADSAHPPPLRLDPDPALVQRYREELREAAGDRPRVGLTWRAGTVQVKDIDVIDRLLVKEVPLAPLLDILAPLDVDVVVLQRHPAEHELQTIQERLGRPWLDASALDQDLNETLALLACLDTVVGVSNTNLHLWAGLGGQAEVLVPYPPEFRWPEGQTASPWFPGFRVYQQPPGQAWQEPLAQLASALRARYAARPV